MRAVDVYARLTPYLAHRPGSGAIVRSHAWLLERSGGRVGGTLFGAPLLTIRVVGRRSGATRDAPLVYVPYRDGYAVVAANAASARMPDWWLNLQARPECEVLVGSRHRSMRARAATGDETRLLWPQLVATYPGFAHYLTLAVRELPVIVLEPSPQTAESTVAAGEPATQHGLSDFQASFRRLETKLYTAIRDPAAASALDTEWSPWDPGRLTGRMHCLLITYKRDGTAIPTPVWFAADGERVLLHCARSDGKLKRIRNNVSVAVAPCSFRGRPLGPPMRATARLLPPDLSDSAEETLRRSFSRRQRLFLRLRGPMDLRHVEVTAAAPQRSPVR